MRSRPAGPSNGYRLLARSFRGASSAGGTHDDAHPHPSIFFNAGRSRRPGLPAFLVGRGPRRAIGSRSRVHGLGGGLFHRPRRGRPLRGVGDRATPRRRDPRASRYGRRVRFQGLCLDLSQSSSQTPCGRTIERGGGMRFWGRMLLALVLASAVQTVRAAPFSPLGDADRRPIRWRSVPVVGVRPGRTATAGAIRRGAPARSRRHRPRPCGVRPDPMRQRPRRRPADPSPTTWSPPPPTCSTTRTAFRARTPAPSI